MRDDATWIVRLRRSNPASRCCSATSGSRVDRRRQQATSLVIDASTVRSGAPRSPAGEAKTDLRTAIENGLPRREAGRARTGGGPRHVADVHGSTLDTGGLYRFGKVTIEAGRDQPQHLQGFIPLHRSRSQAHWCAARSSRSRTALLLFRASTITPGKPTRAFTVPITIRAASSGTGTRRNVGFGTDTGPRSQFAWDRRLVNNAGHPVAADGPRSRRCCRTSPPATSSVGDPALEKEFSAGYISQRLGRLDSERYEAGRRTDQVLGQWLASAVRAGRRSHPSRAAGHPLAAADPGHQLRHAAAELSDRLGCAAVLLRAVRQPAALGSTISWLRFYARGERVWPIHRDRGSCGCAANSAPHWVDLLRTPGSSASPAATKRAGLRARFTEPQDPNATSGSGNKGIGGRHKLVGSIEIERDLPHDLRGAVFFDTGNAFDDWGARSGTRSASACA